MAAGGWERWAQQQCQKDDDQMSCDTQALEIIIRDIKLEKVKTPLKTYYLMIIAAYIAYIQHFK